MSHTIENMLGVGSKALDPGTGYVTGGPGTTSLMEGDAMSPASAMTPVANPLGAAVAGTATGGPAAGGILGAVTALAPLALQGAKMLGPQGGAPPQAKPPTPVAPPLPQPATPPRTAVAGSATGGGVAKPMGAANPMAAYQQFLRQFASA